MADVSVFLENFCFIYKTNFFQVRENKFVLFFYNEIIFWKLFARVMVPGVQNSYFVFVTDCALIFFPGESCFCLLNAVALNFSLIFFRFCCGESHR